MDTSPPRSGLSLFELLLVVGIVAVLGGIVAVMMRPENGKPRLRDEKRRHDANLILNAVFRYAKDEGDFPKEIPVGPPGEICQFEKDCSGILNAVTIDLLVDYYLPAIPVDPGGVQDNGTNYFIKRTATGSVTVYAPEAESEQIMVHR